VIQSTDFSATTRYDKTNTPLCCIPRGPLRDIILHDHDDANVSGHRGFAKTLSSIRRSYFWRTLRKDVEVYVKSLRRVQTREGLRQPRGGLIRPFVPPMKKWEVISMDFVFDLPMTSSGENDIAAIVNKLSRQAHSLSLPPKFDAVDLANLYVAPGRPPAINYYQNITYF
jgi:hypothetical protein